MCATVFLSHLRSLFPLLPFSLPPGAGLRVLVYEYVRNGPLSDHLYAKFQGHLLTFEERLDAALGLAEGLRYLHCHAEKPVVN
ncbi:unnamed protein product [Closterium sp. NIES-65]|nr:unnamed protein product [Closterium sp. NIES-65]